MAGCGGLLRDACGRWYGGFFKFLGSSSILKTEAWGILEGLRLALDLGVDLLEVESDSLMLVNVISG